MLNVLSDLPYSEELKEDVSNVVTALTILGSSLEQLSSECKQRQFSRPLQAILADLQTTNTHLANSLPSIVRIANKGLQCHEFEKLLNNANLRINSTEAELAVLSGSIKTSIEQKRHSDRKASRVGQKLQLMRWRHVIMTAIQKQELLLSRRHSSDLIRQLLELKARLDFRKRFGVGIDPDENFDTSSSREGLRRSKMGSKMGRKSRTDTSCIDLNHVDSKFFKDLGQIYYDQSNQFDCPGPMTLDVAIQTETQTQSRRETRKPKSAKDTRLLNSHSDSMKNSKTRQTLQLRIVDLANNKTSKSHKGLEAWERLLWSVNRHVFLTKLINLRKQQNVALRLYKTSNQKKRIFEKKRKEIQREEFTNTARSLNSMFKLDDGYFSPVKHGDVLAQVTSRASLGHSKLL
ncbi:hypothetical protein P9112_009273 [Eukaryota sp. TZLM1-RC]